MPGAFNLITGYMLQVVGFDHLAERDPESHVTASVDRYSAPPSDILRFGITALTFIIVAVIMVSLESDDM